MRSRKPSRPRWAIRKCGSEIFPGVFRNRPSERMRYRPMWLVSVWSLPRRDEPPPRCWLQPRTCRAKRIDCAIASAPSSKPFERRPDITACESQGFVRTEKGIPSSCHRKPCYECSMPRFLLADHLHLEAQHLVEQRALSEILVLQPA